MMWGEIFVSFVLGYGVWVMVTIGFLGAANLRELRQCRQHIRERGTRVMMLSRPQASGRRKLITR